MSYENSFIIIFLASFFALALMIFRKVPVLLTLSEIPPQKKEKLILRIKKRIAGLSIVKNFHYEVFLQKVVTRIRILSLKTDIKTFDWLKRLREKYHKNKFNKDDHYWEKVKKVSKKEDLP